MSIKFDHHQIYPYLIVKYTSEIDVQTLFLWWHLITEERCIKCFANLDILRFLCAKYIATKEDGKNSVERLHISSSQFKNISILHSDMLCVIQNFEVKQKLFNEAFIYLLIYWTSRLALWRCTSLLCYFPHFPLGYIVSLSFYSTSSFIYQNANIVFINSRVESCNNHDKIFQI